LTAVQRKKVEELVKIQSHNKKAQRQLITYWLKSYETPFVFSRNFNLDYNRFRYIIEVNSSYVKARIRAMLKSAITSLYVINTNRVNTLIDISNNRIKSKQDLMRLVQIASSELLEEYQTTKDPKKKDEILFKAGNLIKLLESVKDEEFIFIKKLAELYNLDVLHSNDENEKKKDEKIEIDEKIIKYIEEKK
jgi:hypothetical protein